MAYIPVTSVLVRRAGDCSPAFCLQFYGAKPRDFYWVSATGPDHRSNTGGDRSGAAPIMMALRRRGLDPRDYVVSPFDIT